MSNDPSDPVKLTHYSHGAGCGCKIAPAQLELILKSDLGNFLDPKLIVGNRSRDDAAVFDLGDDRYLISTNDFFSPIVDDAFDFGRIAATNAISDVYAMGGRPLMAIAILGWPVEKLGPELAQQVVEGGRRVCHDLGIPLAGGHSIDAPEPFFGLAVTGEVRKDHLKRNDTARDGDLIFLTKPLGTGLLSTARKRGKLRPEHQHIDRDIMLRSNVVGALLGLIDGVHALTDVTGFGLAGHLLEVCRGSRLGAELYFDKIPRIPEAVTYLAEGCYPDGAFRNWKSMADHITGAASMDRMMFLSDPQTSGGLLICVAPSDLDRVTALLEQEELASTVIGRMRAEQAIGTIIVH